MGDQLSVEDVLRAEWEVLQSNEEESLSALCISGGGIRSATFGLGAIQGLAEHGLLGKFDYLSTVSGGGYIGSWLIAWVNRAQGIGNVMPHLRSDAPRPAPGEPDPIQHLRDYNSYLSPRLGAFSADLWTLIATVLRNILLNWMVLIPLLMAVLIVPRLYLSFLAFPNLIYEGKNPITHCPDYGAHQFNVISDSLLVAYALPFLSLVLFATALVNTLRYLPGIGGRDHSRYDYVVKILAPLVGAGLIYVMYDSLHYLGRHYTYSDIQAIVFWTTLPCVAAWGLYLLCARQPLRRRLRLLFGPLSLAIAAMAAGIGVGTWAATNFMLWNPDCQKDLSWATFVTIGPPTILLGFCLGTVLFVGLSSAVQQDEDREWMSRAVAGVLLCATAWAGLCGVVLVLPAWILTWRTWGPSALAVGVALTAWLSSAETSFVANANPGATAPRGRARMLSAVASFTPVAFIVLLAGGLSVFTNVLLSRVHALTGATAINWHEHYRLLEHSSPILIAVVAAGLVALSWIMARFVNINTFSLHGMYRERLVRAYLGASNSARQASRFTAFSNTDDIKMAALNAQLRPFHVLNLTLNLVAGDRLAWQQRKAASLTVTSLHCGSSDLGYRPSAEYAHGMSLGTAVAISGAAASPNMGYHSSPVVSFIMTLFNARLGAWLGNPGTRGERTWKHAGPQSAIRSLPQEALGQTSQRSEYVYLSDGGHFENLGLYEMVRRRCRLIVVLDAGCDPDFTYDDLGNALRKIRIDFQIPIEFDEPSMSLLRQKKRRWAVANVRYSAVDGAGKDGRLVYIKPMLLGNEPPDVLSYAAAHAAFPHQPTNDQWFDESQTESYRQMGLFTLAEMCRGWPGGSLADWCLHIEKA
jgi:hypothetical protein